MWAEERRWPKCIVVPVVPINISTPPFTHWPPWHPWSTHHWHFHQDLLIWRKTMKNNTSVSPTWKVFQIDTLTTLPSCQTDTMECIMGNVVSNKKDNVELQNKRDFCQISGVCSHSKLVSSLQIVRKSYSSIFIMASLILNLIFYSSRMQLKDLYIVKCTFIHNEFPRKTDVWLTENYLNGCWTGQSSIVLQLQLIHWM